MARRPECGRVTRAVLQVLGEDRVSGSFYPTMAQVFPLLVLTFVWNSGFLDRLRGQQRLPRGVDPAGVRFWTKPRVRWYTLVVTGVALVATGVTVFVLAGVIPDSYALRITLSCGLVLVLGTLLTRISFDVLWATHVPPAGAETAQNGAGEDGGGGAG